MSISDLNSIISTALAVGTAVVLCLFVLFGRKLSRKFILSVFTVLALFVVSYLGLLGYISHKSVVSVNGGTSVSSLVNPAPTATPNPTSIPTPPLVTITKNVQIPCTECGSPLGLEFQSIEINRNDNLSVFHFKVTNNGSSQEAVNFQHLSLQDDNGNTSPAQAGTANAGDITYLGPTNSEIVIQTFPLALKPGVHYTMSVMVDSSTFKDQSITVSY